MKPKNTPQRRFKGTLPLASVIAAMLSIQQTQAGTTLHWDPANSTNGTSSSGGTGAWSSPTSFWEVSQGAATNFSYPDGSNGRDPVFGGATGGTVTIATGFSPIVDAMTFNATGNASTYVIARTGTGAVSLNAASVPITANVNAEISSVIGQQSAGRGINKLGAGTLTLSGTSANTYTGTTTVSAGTLVLAKTASVAAVSSNVNITGGTLQVNATATEQITGAINVNGGTFDLRGSGYRGGAQSITFNSGVITDGDGTIDSQINLSGNLTIRGNLSMPINVAVTGATSTGIIYDATGNLGTSTVSGNFTLVGSKQITVGDSSGTTNELNISGQINEFGGSAGLTKLGTGTLTLSNANNTYTGATIVSAGTLLVNGALGNTASVAVNSSSTVGGSGSIAGSLSINGSSTFQVVDFLDALTVTGTVTIYNGFGVDDLIGFNWGSVADGTYTLINGTLGAGVFAGLANNSLATAFDIDGMLGSRTAYFQEGSLQLVVIPEPEAALLGGLGMLALLRRRR